MFTTITDCGNANPKPAHSDIHKHAMLSLLLFLRKKADQCGSLLMKGTLACQRQRATLEQLNYRIVFSFVQLFKKKIMAWAELVHLP